MKRIWILGDSFSEHSRYHIYLADLIDNNQYEIINYAMSSFDMQSIIDYWTKTLPKIKKEDILIINLTEPSRYRLSLSKNLLGNVNPYFMPKNSDNTIQNEFHSLGTNASELISNGWLESMRTGHSFYIEKYLNRETIIKFVKYLEIEHTSTSYFENQKELIRALYNASLCDKKFIWSWNNLFNDEFIFTKDKMTDIVFNGEWETMHDVYVNSNGKFGINGDCHISQNCNKILAEYIYKRFILN